MQLRPFNIEDTHLLNAWTGHQDELFKFSGTSWDYPLTEEFLEAYQGAYPGRTQYILESAGQALGFGEMIEDEDNSPRLSRLLIAPEQRGKGCGKELVVQLLQTIQAAAVYLFVLEDNAVARQCYETCGFEYVDHPPFSMRYKDQQYPVIKMQIKP